MSRELIVSVSIKDCEVQTFRAGGNGGQNQNKRDTGVRVIHHPSGAIGESREERGQLANKKRAFRRMINTTEFQVWLKTKALLIRPLDEIVNDQMAEKNIKVEVKEDGKWVE